MQRKTSKKQTWHENLEQVGFEFLFEHSISREIRTVICDPTSVNEALCG